MIDFNLNFRYENEKDLALKDVTGTIEDGKCIVLCGDSGCGKTTLIRCINRLVPTFYEGELKGFCYINGQDILSMLIGDVGELATSVFQDPRSHFFTVNSSTEVAFGLENYGYSHEEINKRVEQAFSKFNLEKLKDRNVYELSSGERQLVSILSAWAMNSDILLLDEPTANLDFAAIQQLNKLLLMLKQEGKTIVLSEHRLHYLRDIADEYWVMSNGKIIHRFSSNEMLSFSDKKLADMSLRTTDLNLVKLQTDKIQPISKTQDTFSAQNISFGYKKNKTNILNGISTTAHTGEVVGLIGSNGTGKTTFGKLATGLLKTSQGKFLYNNNILNNKDLQRKTLFIMQESEFQFFTNSVINELKYGQNDTPQLAQKTEYLLKKVNMWECRNRHPCSLSGGQMQKLTLILAYLSPKPIIVLDEPTAGLDKKSLQSCVDIIKEMQKYKIIFIITHDIELIAQVCTRCICLSKGAVQQEFVMENDSSVRKITEYMSNNFKLTDNSCLPQEKQKSGHCDPRIKLLIVLISMFVVSMTNFTLVSFTLILVLALSFVERFYQSSVVGSIVFALLLGLDYIFPHSVFSYFANFFPRLLLMWISFETIIGQNEAAKTLAALRLYHIPEKIIMILSVIFRFFPVLRNDMKLMSQSIKTRSNFSNFYKKLCAFPEYIEILIVPMALRVIRIAETLSASAETRGINLKRKRNSYIKLNFGMWDILFSVLLICAIIAGVII